MDLNKRGTNFVGVRPDRPTDRFKGENPRISARGGPPAMTNKKEIGSAAAVRTLY